MAMTVLKNLSKAAEDEQFSQGNLDVSPFIFTHHEMISPLFFEMLKINSSWAVQS